MKWEGWKTKIMAIYKEAHAYLSSEIILINFLQASRYKSISLSLSLSLKFLMFCSVPYPHIHIPMPYLLNKTLMVCAQIQI